jgi:hypothetical protein
MTPECNQFVFGFHPQKRREIRAQFDGGAITSDGGGLLLREVEKRVGILRQFAACFTDYRNPDLIEHQVQELVAQRVYGLALGYEDLNDHEELRNDPLLAVLVEKSDPSQEALAGKSTLNRLELTGETASRKERYKKIVLDHGAVDRLLVDIFLAAHREEPKEIILDLDATDDPLHGKQEGRFFQGYYGHYCYLALYIFCGEFLLCARLRPSNIDASAGSVAELKHIVEQIRSAWPLVRIVVRGDSGFCREELMVWCEANRVEYLLGLAKNERLKRRSRRRWGRRKHNTNRPDTRLGCSRSSSIRRGRAGAVRDGFGSFMASRNRVSISVTSTWPVVPIRSLNHLAMDPTPLRSSRARPFPAADRLFRFYSRVTGRYAHIADSHDSPARVAGASP